MQQYGGPNLIIIQQQNKMGNQQCPECHNHLLESQAYGNYEILQENTQYYAVVHKVMQVDQSVKSQVLKELQTRQAINCPHLIKLHNFTLAQQPYGFKLAMYYEYAPKSLRDRIEEMRENDRSFTERQIFGVVYGVESALEVLAQHKIKHCCINLETILFKNNVYKLTDVSSTTSIQGNQDQFLSERLLEKLSYQSLHPIYAYDDDLFSLGMVALVLASQRNVSQFYIWQKNKGSLNKTCLNESLKLIQRKYSNRLTNKIKILLNEGNEDNDRSMSKLQQIDSELSKIMVKGVSYNSTTLSPQKSMNFLQM